MFKENLLENKILVTGGGSGLGKAMSERYLELGAKVYICGRRKTVADSAKEMMDKHGGSVIPISCDIKVSEAIEEMINQIWSEGPLDGLVNNAAEILFQEQRIYLPAHLMLLQILFLMEHFIQQTASVKVDQEGLGKYNFYINYLGI